MHVLAAGNSGFKKITDLKGKRLGVGDLSGVDKNFFSIVLKKQGVDPVTEVEWRQFPADLLGEALRKGEIDALSTSDPIAFVLKRNGALIEVTNNLENGYENLACCVLGIRGSLIRNDRPTASAITRALVEAADWASKHPQEAGAIYAPFAPKHKAEDLAKMLDSVTSDQHPVKQDFQRQVAFYINDLKSVGVIKPSVDADKFAARVCTDVLT
jgi:NitT/TauT family transport system substrate-binding protein